MADSGLQDLSINHLRRKLFEEAIEYYRTTFRLCEKVGNKVVAASVLREMGVAINNRSDPETAEEYLNEAYTRFAALRDTVKMIGTKMVLASNLYVQDRDDKAREAYRHSFDLAKKIGSTYFHRCGLLNYGQYELSNHRYVNAREAFLDAEKLLEHGALTHNHAVLYWLLGNTNKKLKQWETALDYYNRAVQIVSKIEEGAQLLQYLNGPASLYLERGSETRSEGDLEKALHLYREILKKAERVGHKPHIARSHLNIGFLLTQLHQPEQALSHLHAARYSFPRTPGTHQSIPSCRCDRSSAFAARTSGRP